MTKTTESKNIKAGTKVLCNGYEGIIETMHIGQLKGMADVRLDSGCVCVPVSELVLIK